jgi:hypothetical protein
MNIKSLDDLERVMVMMQKHAIHTLSVGNVTIAGNPNVGVTAVQLDKAQLKAQDRVPSFHGVPLTAQEIQWWKDREGRVPPEMYGDDEEVEDN